MLLSVGKMSAHFSRSTWPARHSSVMICRARWHRLTPSSVRVLMSFLLIHCILEEPRARGFIGTPRALLTARSRKGSARRVHMRLIHWHLQLVALADALERVDALQRASSRANRKRGHRVFWHATLSAGHRLFIHLIFSYFRKLHSGHQISLHKMTSIA